MFIIVCSFRPHTKIFSKISCSSYFSSEWNFTISGSSGELRLRFFYAHYFSWIPTCWLCGRVIFLGFEWMTVSILRAERRRRWWYEMKIVMFIFNLSLGILYGYQFFFSLFWVDNIHYVELNINLVLRSGLFYFSVYLFLYTCSTNMYICKRIDVGGCVKSMVGSQICQLW